MDRWRDSPALPEIVDSEVRVKEGEEEGKSEVGPRAERRRKDEARNSGGDSFAVRWRERAESNLQKFFRCHVCRAIVVGFTQERSLYNAECKGGVSQHKSKQPRPWLSRKVSMKTMLAVLPVLAMAVTGCVIIPNAMRAAVDSLLKEATATFASPEFSRVVRGQSGSAGGS